MAKLKKVAVKKVKVETSSPSVGLLKHIHSKPDLSPNMWDKAKNSFGGPKRK